MIIVKNEHRYIDELVSRIARKKGMSVERLARYAFLMGLRLLTERTNNKPKEPLDTLLREHWEIKSDWEIGLLMHPNMSGNTVRKRRMMLGLKKKRGKKSRLAALQNIDPEKFERMVVRDGYTMTEYAESENIQCTRERLRQMAEELGLKHSVSDRTPQWRLVRRARRLGNLNLADRDWLAERLAKSESLVSLAAKLEINERNLYFFIRRLKLTHPSIRKYGIETVDLVCTHCSAPFKRLKRWVDRRIKVANAQGETPNFYCGSSCAGKHRQRVRS